jgi:hypothetical protein
MKADFPLTIDLDPERAAQGRFAGADGAVGDQGQHWRNEFELKVDNFWRRLRRFLSQVFKDRFPAPDAAGGAEFAKVFREKTGGLLPIFSEGWVHQGLLQTMEKCGKMFRARIGGIGHFMIVRIGSRYGHSFSRINKIKVALNII